MNKIFGMPTWLAEVLIGITVTAGLYALVDRYGDQRYAEGRAASKADWDAEKVEIQSRALDEQLASANESYRRIAAQAKVINDQAQDLAAIAADRDAERAAGQRLRQQLQAYVDHATSRGQSAGHHTTGTQCAAIEEAVIVLADLFGEADRFAGELAEAYDSAESAGRTCERTYDTLTPPAPVSQPGPH